MVHPVRFDLLKRQPDPHLWLEVRHFSKELSLSRGDYLIRTGEKVEGLYFIERGTVRMDYCHIDGGEKAIWYIGENSFVGETPCFLESICRTSFVCTAPTVALYFSREVIHEVIIKEYPLLVTNLLVGLAAKVRMLNEHIFTLALDGVPARLCKYLSLYTRRLASGELVASIPLRKYELASLLGIHRATLYKAFKKLEQSGILAVRSKSVIFIINERQFFSFMTGSGIE